MTTGSSTPPPGTVRPHFSTPATVVCTAFAIGLTVAAVRQSRQFRGRGQRPTSNRWYALAGGFVYLFFAYLTSVPVLVQFSVPARYLAIAYLALPLIALLCWAVGRPAAGYERRQDNRFRRELGQPVARFLIPPGVFVAAWLTLAFTVGIGASVLYPAAPKPTAQQLSGPAHNHPLVVPVALTLLPPVALGMAAAAAHGSWQRHRRRREGQRVADIDRLQQQALHSERDHGNRAFYAAVVPVGAPSPIAGTRSWRRWAVRCSCTWSAPQHWASSAGRWRPATQAQPAAYTARDAHLTGQHQPSHQDPPADA